MAETTPSPETPVYDESIGGALIDSARISVMAAMHVLQPVPDLIVLPGDEAMPSLHDCLTQAMEWLNHARAITIEQSDTPPTSLHVVGGAMGPIEPPIVTG